MKRRTFVKSLGPLSAGFCLSKPPLKAFEFKHRIGQYAGDDSAVWEIIREQFLFPDEYMYFNTGGIGALPAIVLNRVKDHMERSQIHPGPGHDHKLWDTVKAKCATLFGHSCLADEMALCSTATEGINIIVNGLPLKRGDEIITSTHEHPALNIALLNRRARDSIKIRTFEPDLRIGKGNIDRIKRLITSRTRLIFISHITCTTGQRFPEAEICALARKNGIWTAFDGALVVGAIRIDVNAYGVDFYAISGHKWLLGPKRTGVLYVRKEMLDILRPVTVGAYSDRAHDILAQSLTLQETAQRYEYATQNDSLFCGLNQAIDFINTIGVDRIWKHNRMLAEQFYSGLRKMDVEILSPEESEFRTSMITFKIPYVAYRDAAATLSKQQFRVRVVPEAGLEAIRVSMHVYNHEEQVAKLLTAIAGIAA